MLSVNYGCVKESTKWFLDAAGVTFRITFDDVMMFMTLFVLFADNIRLMVADKNVDDDFIVVNSLCLFAFIIELLLIGKKPSFVPSWQNSSSLDDLYLFKDLYRLFDSSLEHLFIVLSLGKFHAIFKLL